MSKHPTNRSVREGQVNQGPPGRGEGDEAEGDEAEGAAVESAHAVVDTANVAGAAGIMVAGIDEFVVCIDPRILHHPDIEEFNLHCQATVSNVKRHLRMRNRAKQYDAEKPRIAAA